MLAFKWHRFSREGSQFALNPQSLVLYKVTQKPGWLQSSGKYVPISRPLRSVTNLDRERHVLSKHNQDSRAYCYFNISHACNLACSYCFADGGAYGGPPELMNERTCRQAVDWILRSTKSKQITFNFFGGEPLLNPSVLYYAVEYANQECQKRQQHFSVIVSTNGTGDLTETGERLASVHYWLAISIDGGTDLQNCNRPFIDAGPSYDPVARNVKSYMDRFGPSKISARAVWRRGQSQLVNTAGVLLELGFRQVLIGRETSFGATGCGSANPTDGRDFDEILGAYDELARWYVERLNKRQSVAVQPLMSMMRAVLLSHATRLRCSAGVNKWCIVPDGRVYPCHHFIGQQRFEIGNVLSAASVARFPTGLTTSAEPQFCKKCWARHWCYASTCTYLDAIGMDVQRLDGFCKHMRGFLEMVCFHVANLSETGRDTLLKL